MLLEKTLETWLNAHTNIRLFSIKYADTLVWNNVPPTIRLSPELLI